MATDMNITIKQFNGTDYDTLYPNISSNSLPAQLELQGNPTTPLGAATKEYVDSKEQIGDIKMTVNTLGSGYLPCNGTEVSSATYPDLYNALPPVLQSQTGGNLTGAYYNSVVREYDETVYLLNGVQNATSLSLYTQSGIGPNWTLFTNISVPNTGSSYTLNFLQENGKFFILLSGGYILSSDDGTNWSTVYTNTNGILTKGFAYGNGYYVALCNNGAAYSTDGETWVLNSNLTTSSSGKLTFYNGFFLAVYATTSNDISTKKFTLPTNNPSAVTIASHISGEGGTAFYFDYNEFLGVVNNQICLAFTQDQAPRMLVSSDGANWVWNTQLTQGNKVTKILYFNNWYYIVQCRNYSSNSIICLSAAPNLSTNDDTWTTVDVQDVFPNFLYYIPEPLIQGTTIYIFSRYSSNVGVYWVWNIVKKVPNITSFDTLKETNYYIKALNT